MLSISLGCRNSKPHSLLNERDVCGDIIEGDISRLFGIELRSASRDARLWLLDSSYQLCLIERACLAIG